MVVAFDVAVGVAMLLVASCQSESAATSTSAAMPAQINHPAVKRRQLGPRKHPHIDEFVTPSAV